MKHPLAVLIFITCCILLAPGAAALQFSIEPAELGTILEPMEVMAFVEVECTEALPYAENMTGQMQVVLELDHIESGAGYLEWGGWSQLAIDMEPCLPGETFSTTFAIEVDPAPASAQAFDVQTHRFHAIIKGSDAEGVDSNVTFTTAYLPPGGGTAYIRSPPNVTKIPNTWEIYVLNLGNADGVFEIEQENHVDTVASSEPAPVHLLCRCRAGTWPDRVGVLLNVTPIAPTDETTNITFGVYFTPDANASLRQRVDEFHITLEATARPDEPGEQPVPLPWMTAPVAVLLAVVWITRRDGQGHRHRDP